MVFPHHSGSSVRFKDDIQEVDRTCDTNTLPEVGQLWHAFKLGSEAALTSIYQQYIHALYHYGERITSDKELIEDSIHDLFVNLWRRRESIGQASSVKYYLFKGVRRQIIKNLARKRKLPCDGNVPEDYTFEITFSCESEKIRQEVSEAQRDTLLKAINRLSRRQKEAITLKFYDDLTYQEVASVMSLSVRATYTLIYRALDVLKENTTVSYLLFLLAFCH